MNAGGRFPIIETQHGDAGAIGFLRGVFARITWKSVVGAQAISLLLLAVYVTSHSYALTSTESQGIPPAQLKSRLVVNATAGLTILLAVLAADEAVARGARRLRTYALAVFVGACAAGALQWEIRAWLHLRSIMSATEYLVRITQPGFVALTMTIYGGLATFVYVNLRTAHLAGRRHHAAEIARGEARRRTLESKLQAMQARVEPQFLFNTLAQVKQLFDVDPERAGVMLDDLIAYLRAALPHLRESSSTLGKEVELARAYLNIMRVRLGDRLSFDITVPDALRQARLPPMMLLPLVDHALVYGLAPARDGGTIRIVTNVVLHRLRLSIADDGAGFVPGAHPDGIEEIEERLEALYGDEAWLRLERMQVGGIPRGTRATLEIPYETDVGGHR